MRDLNNLSEALIPHLYLGHLCLCHHSSASAWSGPECFPFQSLSTSGMAIVPISPSAELDIVLNFRSGAEATDV